jgi:predicted HicB family RNase H-like nuclease
MAEALKQLVVRVPAAKHQRWKLEAVKRAVSLGKLVELAMDTYLKRGA